MSRRHAIVLMLLLLGTGLLRGQSLDVAGGGGGVFSSNASGSFWPAFSATGWFNRRVGVNTEFSWRTQREYLGTGEFAVRPWVWELNGAARLPLPHSDLQLLAGFAAFHTYTITPCNCPPFPPNDFIFGLHTYRGFHLGPEIKFHLRHRWFLQFGYHLYLASGLDHPSRVAIMLGYTFGGR